MDNTERNHRRRFGQNFLIDREVVQNLVEDIAPTQEEWIIEIGPGQGALTRYLMGRCDRLTALEIDPKWIEHLEKKFGGANLEVRRADAMKIDVPELVGKSTKPVIAGNLPYNRASPILFNFVPHIRSFKRLYVMVQNEVAKRIAAKPGGRNFGFLSVFIQTYAQAEIKRRILPDSFRPRPKVHSATVELTPLAEPVLEDPLYLPFVECCFSQKRKMLYNSLAGFYSKGDVLKALSGLGIADDVRAEALQPVQFAQMFHILGPPQKIK